jgi:heat shock protein HslJ
MGAGDNDETVIVKRCKKEKTMDIRRRILVGMTLVLAAMLAACATAEPDSPPTEGSTLLGSGWKLVLLNGGDLIEGKAITLRFGEASIEGSGGCNTYGGSYTASEDSLRLSGVYWTEMACMEPEGIMEQEQAYFQALNTTARYRVDGDRLALYDEAGAQVLVFTAADSPSATQTTPSPVPPTATAVAAATPTRVLPTATPEPPTAIPAVPEPPAGSKQYVDAASGVSLWVPESWTIVEPGPHGGPTILQSFPVDKYVGGEAFQQGDTKCDLTIHPPDISVADVVQQLKSDPSITIVSEQEIVLQSGRPGTRMEVESMSRSLVLFAEVDERAVVLTCFGELAPFDEIAVTLAVSQESALIATIEAQEALPTGAVVKVRFTLTNISSGGFYVLKWFTPLEGLAGDIFRVQRDGVDLAYRGKLVKRGSPISEDYVWIDAGGSISAEVDLAQGYDFSQTGQYTVQFRSPRLSHSAKTSGEQADSVDELEMIWISSSPVSVMIGNPSGS